MITDVSRDESIFELAPEIEILVKGERTVKNIWIFDFFLF